MILISESFSQNFIQTNKRIPESKTVIEDTLVLFAGLVNYNVDSTLINKLVLKFDDAVNLMEKYKTVPDTILDKYFKKNTIPKESCFDDCYFKAALDLKVKYLIQFRIGKVAKEQTIFTLDADLIYTEDATIRSSTTYKVENKFEDFFDGTSVLINELFNKKKPTALLRNMAKYVYKISFDKIYLDDSDFHRSIFNNPLPVSLLFLENDILIKELFIGQKRNDVDFSKRTKAEIKMHPHFKEVKFKSNSIYKLIIMEDGFHNNVSRYEITFPEGEWPFDRDKVYFTDKTYLYVSQNPDFPDNKKYPIHKYLHRYKNFYCLSLGADLDPTWKYKGIEFYAFTKTAEWNEPVFEYLHKVDSVFLYSMDSLNFDIWEKKETAFFALRDSIDGSVPIYRFFHKEDNDYYYTSKKILEEGWDNLGLEFYAFPNK